MFINRIELKQRAKQLMRMGNPSPIKIALIYLLATSCLVTVVGTLIPNPIDRFTEVFNQWMLVLQEEPGVIGMGTMDAMSQQLRACFQGPQAMIGLLAAVLLGLYSMVVSMGYFSHALQKVRGEETGVGELFGWFGLAGKIIVLQLLKVLFIYLWCMLFIIPGLIAAYRYRMAEYCLLDDPDISALEAIRRSKKMMHNHKMEMFTLELSFFGWLFLESLAALLVTRFVASIVLVEFIDVSVWIVTLVNQLVVTAISMYLVPYMQYTYAGYYVELKKLAQAPPVNPGTTQPPFVNPPDSFGQDPWSRREPDHSNDDPNNQGWNQ